MPSSHKFTVRLCGLAGTGLLAVFCGPTIFEDVAAAYPRDTAHAAALQDCAAGNPAFNRLDAIERNDCYAVHAATTGASNEVDLKQSAGRGHQPQNDVIQQQQLTRYFDVRTAQTAR